jgi:hypothetical protein
VPIGWGSDYNLFQTCTGHAGKQAAGADHLARIFLKP